MQYMNTCTVFKVHISYFDRDRKKNKMHILSTSKQTIVTKKIFLNIIKIHHFNFELNNKIKYDAF